MHNEKEASGLVERIRYHLLESNITLAIILSTCLGYTNTPAVRIRVKVSKARVLVIIPRLTIKEGNTQTEKNKY